jgi:hypothetical protein
MTSDEVLKKKGQPIARNHSDWLYNSIDSAHDGVLTVSFSHPGEGETGPVSSSEFTGHDETSAPAEMPYLNSLKIADVVRTDAASGASTHCRHSRTAPLRLYGCQTTQLNSVDPDRYQSSDSFN